MSGRGGIASSCIAVIRTLPWKSPDVGSNPSEAYVCGMSPSELIPWVYVPGVIVALSCKAPVGISIKLGCLCVCRMFHLAVVPQSATRISESLILIVGRLQCDVCMNAVEVKLIINCLYILNQCNAKRTT